MGRWIALVAGLSVTAAGCGRSGPSSAGGNPVKGLVTLNQKPLPGAMVMFVPLGGGGGRPASAMTGPDGTYSVAESPDGGLAPGSYTVAVSLRLGPDGKRVPEGTSPNAPGVREALPSAISNPGESRLMKTIGPDRTTPVDLALTAPGVQLPK